MMAERKLEFDQRTPMPLTRRMPNQSCSDMHIPPFISSWAFFSGDTVYADTRHGTIMMAERKLEFDQHTLMS